MNKVILIGRLVKEPELKDAGESKVCTFTIAVNRDKENTDFINCVVWNLGAETLCKYQHKGSQIGIEGRLQTRTYETNGQKKTISEVICHNIEYLDTKKEAPPKEDVNPFEQFGNSIQTEVEPIEIKPEDLPF